LSDRKTSTAGAYSEEKFKKPDLIEAESRMVVSRGWRRA
jgi:hypothetical protein